MRISDWSSDVCSSDLKGVGADLLVLAGRRRVAAGNRHLPLLPVFQAVAGGDGVAGVGEPEVAAGQDNAALVEAVHRMLAGGSLAGRLDHHVSVDLQHIDLGGDRKSTRLNSSH